MNRFNQHTHLYHLLPVRQSAYRQFHSTETAITIVHNDIVCAIDAGNVSVLVLPDLSAAFDTVDHGVLLDVLRHWFGVADVALNWFSSYLSDRIQSFSVASGTSRPVNLICSVPQGSVIGPKKFVAYTEDIAEEIDTFSINHHLYADDTQL